MAMFAGCGADILLAGHLHASHAGDTSARYKLGNFAALVVQAGTATSVRGRGEANSFNVLRLDRPRVTIERHSWTGDDFALALSNNFVRTAGGWQHG
jgi:predicted phosphodiesterase